MSSEYEELAKARVHDKRNLVISANNHKGGYTIAQQVLVEESNRETFLFMKGSIHVKDLKALYDLRDALNEAISKEEQK